MTFTVVSDIPSDEFTVVYTCAALKMNTCWNTLPKTANLDTCCSAPPPDLVQYQAAPVVLPADVVNLRGRLSRVQQELTLAGGGTAPSTSDLAAAAGLSVAKVQQVMDAAQLQVSGQAGRRAGGLGH